MHYIGLLHNVIPLKVFLDMLPRSIFRGCLVADHVQVSIRFKEKENL